MTAAEQNGNYVEIQQLEPQPVVSIKATVRIAGLAEVMGDRVLALSGYLQQSGGQPGALLSCATTELNAVSAGPLVVSEANPRYFTIAAENAPIGGWSA